MEVPIKYMCAVEVLALTLFFIFITDCTEAAQC